MKIKKTMPFFIKYLPTVLVFALIIVIAIAATRDIGKNTEAESLSIVENSIRRAAITCYAQEGSYPQSIDYLKENYGLYLSDDYVVHYDIFASNIMPNITVIRKQVTE